jgi:DNA uptake protein ComE-like DNA-binding protein
MVDGLLRCDDEAPREVAALCEGEGPRSQAPIEAGDALDTSKLCVHQEVARGRAKHGWTRMDPQDLKVLAQPVDVNHASAEELTSLPGVGPVIARRIVEGRPYDSVDALERVKGIGPVRLERLRARARID